VSDGEKIGHQL